MSDPDETGTAVAVGATVAARRGVALGAALVAAPWVAVAGVLGEPQAATTNATMKIATHNCNTFLYNTNPPVASRTWPHPAG